MVASWFSVAVLLSGRCNLACSYCYQKRRTVRARPRWRTITTAIDCALSASPGELAVEFTGGEPLLEESLLRKTVLFAERRCGGRTRVQFGLTTNGALLTRDLLAFLFAHRFTVKVSLDGVSAVQGLRCPGTFAALDHLLDVARAEFPAQFREHVVVSVTLVPAAVPRFAHSIRYLVSKGVARIGVTPILTWDPDWNDHGRADLENQVGDIVAFAADYWRRTGDVPLAFLGRPPLRDVGAPMGEFLCGAPAGYGFNVDPDGRAMACPVLGPSLTLIPNLAKEAARVLDLGLVTDDGLMRRVAGLRHRARKLAVFTGKRSKRSSYGACADCRFLADCSVCPAAICHVPGNQDPHLIPDFVCAFNQITLAARGRFDELTGGATSEAWYEEVRRALREVGDAIESAVGDGSRVDHRWPAKRPTASRSRKARRAAPRDEPRSGGWPRCGPAQRGKGGSRRPAPEC